MRERRAYRISGIVQGVGFRYFTRSEARSLGLGGWVCNRSDGSVEVQVEGEESVLRRFESQLRLGPPTGEVEQVDRIEAERDERFGDFEIRFG